MYRDKRIIVCIPAGRKRYLEILIRYLYSYKSIIDEIRFWINTTNIDDITFMLGLHNGTPDLFKIDLLPPEIKVNGNYTVCHFFKNCVEPNTVYVRFDDDIVETDTLDAFIKFLDFRIDHPEYFMVYANILNNSIMTHLHQRFEKFTLKNGIADYNPLDKLGWINPQFAETLHRQIIEKPDLSSFRLSHQWINLDHQRISINCFSWLGEEFAKFNGKVHEEDELWLSSYKPREINKYNVVFGDYVCVHYAYGNQREYLDSTDVLKEYIIRVNKNIVEKLIYDK